MVLWTCSVVADSKHEPIQTEVLQKWKTAVPQIGWVRIGDKPWTQFVSGPQDGFVRGFKVRRWENGLLAKLPNPETPFGLDLSGSRITDDGLKEIVNLTNLQSLSLGGCKVTDRGIKELANFKRLEALDLSITRITDAGLKDLAKIKSLRTLNLGDTEITDAGLNELVAIEGLETLILGVKNVTDAGMKQLAKMKKLRVLDISYLMLRTKELASWFRSRT